MHLIDGGVDLATNEIKDFLKSKQDKILYVFSNKFL